MKLVDTCIWIEVTSDTPTGQAYKRLLSEPHKLMTSTMVVYELRKWLARHMESEAADELMALVLTAHVVEPTSTIALQAAELSKTYQLHAMDALIYATALEHDAQLVTCDVHFKDLPQVDYTAKSK
ncbi:MAG: type II toxin-antitoxin system VapC family toxin [Polaromonas sp.]